MESKIRKHTIENFVMMTGAIMGEIDRFFKSNRHKEVPIQSLGGFAYFLMFSMVSFITKNIPASFSYSEEYSEAIFKGHASNPTDIQEIKETYNLNRKLYGTLTNFKCPFSQDAILKLSKEFINLVCEDGIKPASKKELIDFLYSLIQKWQHDMTTKMKNELLNFENNVTKTQ